jgi:hypothetical protein
VTRDPNDYLDWVETEYDIHIEPRDLSGSIHENVEQYQVEFDAIVADFYDAADEIEKEAFEACETAAEEDPAGADEEIDEALGEARERILKEGERLTDRLNSLNLRFSHGLSSFLPSSINDEGPPRVADSSISWARFQFLTERVQYGTATTNERREFITLRREFFPGGTGDGGQPLTRHNGIAGDGSVSYNG